MFGIFGNIKTTSLLISSLIINICTLIYLISIHGFSHINIQVAKSTLVILIFVAAIILIIITVISFILYISFKTTYKKLTETLDNITKEVNEQITK